MSLADPRGEYVHGVGVARGWVSQVVWHTHPPGHGTSGYPPKSVLTPSSSHQNTCSWQAGTTHPTGMLSCSSMNFYCSSIPMEERVAIYVRPFFVTPALLNFLVLLVQEHEHRVMCHHGPVDSSHHLFSSGIPMPLEAQLTVAYQSETT